MVSAQVQGVRAVWLTFMILAASQWVQFVANISIKQATSIKTWVMMSMGLRPK